MKLVTTRQTFLYNFLWISKHFIGEKLTSILFGWLENSNKASISRRLKSMPLAKKIQIKTFEASKWNEFSKECLKSNKPMILKGGASSWPAINKWTPQFFKENYGHVKQLIIKSTGEEIFDDKHLNKEMQWTTIGEIIDSFKTPTPGYASFNPIVHDYKELMDDFDHKLLFKLRSKIASGTQYQLFIGQDGSFTDLHSTIVNNFFIQISGKKQWRLYDGKYNPLMEIAITREPCFHSILDIKNDLDSELLKYADYYEFELEPGDVFYNPPFQWHRVENKGNSIGLAFKWTSMPSFSRQSLIQGFLTTFSTNPFVWTVLGSNGNYMNTFTGNRDSFFLKLLKRNNQTSNLESSD